MTRFFMKLINRKLSILWVALGVTLPFICGVSGCQNAFQDTADTKSDAALLFQAQLRMDEKAYGDAISLITSMSSAGFEKRETKVVLAAAYAGACGLELIALADHIASEADGGAKLYPMLLRAYPQATADHVANCKLGEATLLSISTTPSDLTPDENILLAFIEFTKIGSILAASGLDQTGDGTIDPAFDPCVDDADNIVDADVQHLGTGITLAMAALAASGTPVAEEITGVFEPLCTAVDAALGTTGFCDQTDPSDFDALEVRGLRALIKSNEIGFNTCGGAIGSSASCICL